MTGIAPEFIPVERFQQQQNHKINAAKYGELRPLTPAQLDASRYAALAGKGRLTRDEQHFVDAYAATHDPFAFSKAAIDAGAAFAGGYTPKGTPVSARQPIVPVRGPNASNPPKVHRNSFDYVGETHVYAIKGPQGTVKIGESTQGVRKSDGASIRGEKQARDFARETGQQYRSEIRGTFPDKQSAVEYQTRFIETFRKLYGEQSLPKNKTNR